MASDNQFNKNHLQQDIQVLVYHTVHGLIGQMYLGLQLDHLDIWIDMC